MKYIICFSCQEPIISYAFTIEILNPVETCVSISTGFYTRNPFFGTIIKQVTLWYTSTTSECHEIRCVVK